MSLNNNKRCTTPTIQDKDGELSSHCEKLQGGVKSPSVPAITVTLQNQNNPTFWTDENLVPVLTEEGDFLIFDNVF